jgi:hypothetical protein
MMRLNREKLFELMDKYYDGNYNLFSRELNVDTSHLHRFLNKGIGGGIKLSGSVIRFCKDHQLPFEDYFTFE